MNWKIRLAYVWLGGRRGTTLDDGSTICFGRTR